ncbi:hypothetical protein K501DRAFT_330893 [Backusella circina FSU 941]|nr:hypothetical protein K501DRAFT_330893 [Backusella circina FSU 941]
MSRLFWDTPLLSPYIVSHAMNMDLSSNKNRPLKRVRSTEFDNPTKRSKLTSQDLPISNPPLYPPTNLHIKSPLEPISISTRTPANYNEINNMLHTLHCVRYGDPEAREWDNQTDHEMEEASSGENEYQAVNSLLKQAFLERHSLNSDFT